MKHIPWTAFALKTSDWERMNDTQIIILDANDTQQYFSSKRQPTLWHTIPAMEELQMAWESKTVSDKRDYAEADVYDVYLYDKAL
ncbi:hypothetical protein EDB19DRAFT_1910923 [Suillus lakei]|nr:hypothetical protein EDB19DRAFT_1910923 [Suillus lakei]